MAISCYKKKDNIWLDFYTFRTLIIWCIYLITISIFSVSNYNKNLFGLVLLILIITISVGGIFIVYIYPKYIYSPLLDYVFKGKELITLDIIFHQLPLLIHILLMLNGYWSFSSNLLLESIIISLIWIIVYISFVNPFNVYFCKL
jgi:hypothetical protein